MAGKNWIKGAIKHPGSLTTTAKRMGLISGGSGISAHALAVLARSRNPTTRRRAALAKTLKGMHH